MTFLIFLAKSKTLAAKLAVSIKNLHPMKLTFIIAAHPIINRPRYAGLHRHYTERKTYFGFLTHC